MRKTTVLLISAAIGFITASEASAAEKLRIGLVLPGPNEMIVQIDVGVRDRAKEVGNIEVLTTSSYSGEEQAKALENYVAEHVDAIIYDSMDAAANGPAIVKANEANIPVIAVISEAERGKIATMITPDWTEDGRMIGRWMSKKLGKDGIVAEIEGAPSDQAGQKLTTGYNEGLASGGIDKLVAMAPSNWEREKGLSVATDILTAHPNLQGLYAAIDDVALGAFQALRAAGRAHKVLLAGHNGTCEGISAILKGDLNYTVMLFSRQMGRTALDSALKALKGEQIAAMMPSPAFGIDTPTAQAIAGGNLAEVPADVASEIKDRVMKAAAGCK